MFYIYNEQSEEAKFRRMKIRNTSGKHVMPSAAAVAAASIS
jgi:hypothetical protein